MRKSKAEKKKQREIHNRRQSIEVRFYPGHPPWIPECCRSQVLKLIFSHIQATYHLVDIGVMNNHLVSAGVSGKIDSRESFRETRNFEPRRELEPTVTSKIIFR